MYYSKDIGYNVVVEPMVLDYDIVKDIQPVQTTTVTGLPPGGKDRDDISDGGETAQVDNLQALDNMDDDDDDVKAPEVRTMSG
jgi:hypothetical protein